MDRTEKVRRSAKSFHVLEFGYDDVRVVDGASLIAMGVTDQGYWEVGSGFGTFDEADKVRREILSENEAELEELGLSD